MFLFRTQTFSQPRVSTIIASRLSLWCCVSISMLIRTRKPRLPLLLVNCQSGIVCGSVLSYRLVLSMSLLRSSLGDQWGLRPPPPSLIGKDPSENPNAPTETTVCSRGRLDSAIRFGYFVTVGFRTGSLFLAYLCSLTIKMSLCASGVGFLI